MGGNNERCLDALLKYLEDEHMDKKKTPLNPPASEWHREIVKDIPQQMNGESFFMHLYVLIREGSRNQIQMTSIISRQILSFIKSGYFHLSTHRV